MKQKRLKFSARTIIIVIAMLFTCIGVSAQENTCIVAGNETSIFGSSWNGQDENNKMVKGNDGKYRKDYTVNKEYKIVQLKVVDGENWIGDANGNNIEFKLTGAGTFTVVFDPNNNNISVTGSIVQTITELEYTTVYVAGNGEDEWLNGVNWTTNAEENKMTEIEPGIWEITFYGVPKGYGRQVKFAIDGEWTFNFGGTFEGFGTCSADYNGSPITFNTDDDCDIRITLDLRDFDFTTKQGAKFTINIDLASNPDDPEPEPNPAATVTTAPKAAENVFAGTTTALVSAGSASGGTMMYKMTTTNQKPSNVDGFSTTIPTAENITGTCSVYVWYYVKGDSEHRDSQIFGPVTVSVISSADFSVSANGYTIHTATGWDVFCNMLANNDKGIFIGKTICLGASFEVSRMAGSDYHDFTGTFDGGGYTLTFNYGENNTPANADYAAPFRNVENGNIQNLHVMGHIYTSAKYAAGFVGKLYGSVNIKNCRSSIVVHSSTSGDGTHGGFVATNGGTLSIEGCVFDGKLLTTGQTATGNCGGFIGWGSGTITNSLYAPAKLDGGEIEVQAGTGDYPSCTFVRNGSAGDNCYYTRLLGTAQGKAPHTVSAGQDVSIGAIALSGKATTYSVSGITAYANGGIKRTVNETTTFYYGSGDQVSLTLSNSAPTTLHTFSQYTASNDGTLSGSASPYTLTMPDADVTIDATWTMQAVNYLDANGATQTCTNYTAIYSGNKPTTLAAGWYVVTGDVNYTNGITLSGNATLILADNCQMNVGTSGSRINGYGIYGEDLETGNDYDLTITSQSLGTSMGALSVYTTGAYKRGIRPGALTINGGNITADSDGEWAHALTAFNDLTINGGTVRANATGSGADAIFSNGNFHYNGGTVTATATYDKAIFVFGKHYTFNWRNPGDRITIGFTGLYAPDDATATFTRLFTDTYGNYHGGTLTGTELNALKGVTLSPAYDIPLLDNADNSATIGADYLDGVTQFVTLQGRTLYKDGGWNTLCLPFDITNAQLDALDHPLHGSKIVELDVESKEEDGVTPKTRLDNDGTLYLYFNSVYDYMMPSEGLKAGKPYLVKWEKLNGYDENPSDFDISDPVFSGVTIDASASTPVNFNGGAFRGTYSPINFEANDKSILFLGAENKLYWPNADMTLKACRAYFQLNNGAEARAIVLNFNDDEDNTTGIAPLLSPEGDDAGASPRGGLVGASWYDLQGRRLSQKPTKAGIYVRNGRKKVLK